MSSEYGLADAYRDVWGASTGRLRNNVDLNEAASYAKCGGLKEAEQDIAQLAGYLAYWMPRRANVSSFSDFSRKNKGEVMKSKVA